jgi:hypothetical protein
MGHQRWVGFQGHGCGAPGDQEDPVDDEDLMKLGAGNEDPFEYEKKILGLRS